MAHYGAIILTTQESFSHAAGERETLLMTVRAPRVHWYWPQQAEGLQTVQFHCSITPINH